MIGKILLSIFCITSTGIVQAAKTQKIITYHYKKLKSSEGLLENGQKEGLWHYWTRTGNLSKTIEYHQNTPHGLFTEYDTNRVLFSAEKWKEPDVYKACLDSQQRSPLQPRVQKTGAYDQGKKTGNWKTYHKSVLVYEIAYANDEYEGESKEYSYTTGNLKKVTHFHLGRPHGLYREYTTNGTVKIEGHYENGRETGNWIKMDHADRYVRTYKNGQLDGAANRYDARDSLVEHYMYKNGKKNGSFFYIKGNGHNKHTGEYLNDKENGPQREYYDGQLETETYMREGKKNGPYARYNKGILVEKGFYQQDKKDSVWVTVAAETCTTTYKNNLVMQETCVDGQKRKTKTITRDPAGAMTVTTWHSNGKKASETIYTTRQTTFRKWNEKGKLVMNDTEDPNEKLFDQP